MVYLNDKGHLIVFVNSMTQEKDGSTDLGAHVLCIDPKSGKILWDLPLRMSLNGGGGNVYADPTLGIVYLFLFKKVRTGENFFGPTYKTTYAVVGFDLNREEVLFKWSVPDREEIDGTGIP